ncbi:MAG: phenylalanine--tRNA ligase subunit beta [Acidobacteriota bacterium]
MRISVEWLKDFVDWDLVGDPAALAATLTNLGLAVDGVEETEGDSILELDVTTNRPDCLNHLGVARELAAYFRLQLRLPRFDPVPAEADLAERLPFDITIEDPELCPRYAGRVITGVEVGESPDWLKRRLEAIGQRPLNNVVDVTNYVLFAVGHPLHAFDYEKLAEHRIVVRRARPGECIRTLDGVNREPTPEMLMICDARVPVAVAGVMGGEETEISPSTRTILLESAYFDPVSIRRTSKGLGLSTEASYRFERGADPEMPVKALNLATRLLVELCGGRCAGEVKDVYPRPVARKRLRVRLERIRRVVGVTIPPEDVKATLAGLEFAPEWKADGGAFEVTVPSFRQDVAVEDDLVEEAARHYGYERVPSHYPRPQAPGRDLPTAPHDRIIGEILQGYGFSQAINYVFTSPEREVRLLGRREALVALANPLSEAESHLRSTLLPGLVEAVLRNLHFGQRDVRLFELGKTYHPGTVAGEVREVARLGMAATGAFHAPFYASTREEYGFFHLKGVVETLLEALGRRVAFRPADSVEFLHPGIAAELLADDDTVLGIAGALHPKLVEALKFPAPVLLCELNLEPLYARGLPEPRFQPINRFPVVTRDLSFFVDKDVAYATIVEAVQNLRVPELKSVRLIDLYHGPSLPSGKISLTVRLTFEAGRTLTQDEVAAHCERVMSTLVERLGVQPR